MNYRYPIIGLTLAIVVTALGACASQSPAPLTDSARTLLEQMHDEPDSAGELIYTGRVTDADDPADSILFTYERRVRQVESIGANPALKSTHITRNSRDQIVVSESALTDAGYGFKGFEAINRQQGYAARVTLGDDGRTLTFLIDRAGKQERKTELVSDPVVAGPSLFGYVRQHWLELGSGRTMDVRLLVPDRATTFGFTIEHHQTRNGIAQYRVAPSHWLIGLAVDPLLISFDAETRRPLAYNGLVPPMRERAGKLSALTALVKYEMRASDYR